METLELRELDVQIAEKVMGWKIKGKDSSWLWWGVPPGWTEPQSVQIPHYSSDMASAWKIVERMRDLWTAWTAKMSANQEAAAKKYDRMSDDEKSRYFGNAYDLIAAEMAGPRPFDDEVFFGKLHRHADRRWPWAFLYMDPPAICNAALAAFPLVPAVK